MAKSRKNLLKKTTSKPAKSKAEVTEAVHKAPANAGRVNLIGGLDSPRHDIALNKLDESQYTHRTTGVLLTPPKDWQPYLEVTHARGVSVFQMQRSTGLTVETIAKVLGLDYESTLAAYRRDKDEHERAERRHI